jgi:hypothetical protein
MTFQDSKDQLIKREYENNARKRRKIEKDKHDFDMPKPGKHCRASGK